MYKTHIHYVKWAQYSIHLAISIATRTRSETREREHAQAMETSVFENDRQRNSIQSSKSHGLFFKFSIENKPLSPHPSVWLMVINMLCWCAHWAFIMRPFLVSTVAICFIAYHKLFESVRESVVSGCFIQHQKWLRFIRQHFDVSWETKRYRTCKQMAENMQILWSQFKQSRSTSSYIFLLSLLLLFRFCPLIINGS